MAVGGLGSTGTNLSSLSGYGGLASGLDRDQLIKDMTAGTRSKIAKQNQAKTKIGWQQESLRNITSKLYQFSNKYMSYSSSSNLLGTKLFSRNSITALGANSKMIGVSGTAAGASTMSILGVRQMAKNAQLTTLEKASTPQISSSDVAFNLDTETDVNLISGESIYIKYGDTNYSVVLKDETGHEYDNPTDAAAAINRALKEVDLGKDRKLGDVMEATVSADGEMIFKATGTDDTGNQIKLAGGSGNVLKNLGFLRAGEKIGNMPSDRTMITDAGLQGVEKPTFLEPQSIAKQLGGKSISFNYNGKIEWIDMPKEEDLVGKTMEDVQKHLQKELDDKFGNGRIRVGLDVSTDGSTGSLSFATTKPKTVDGKVVPGDIDETSVLSITGASKGVIGNTGILGMQEGASNRLNTQASYKNSGLKGLTGLTGTPELKINGVEIEISEKDSIRDIMDKINNSEAGVTVTYQANTDRFVMSSTKQGASGQIAVEGNFAEAMFGDDSTGHKIEQGQDAIIAVKYPGSDEVIEIERGSNSFTIDGLNISLKGKFGYTAGAAGLDGLDSTSEAVTFDAKVDSENTTKVVKEMIDAYNEVLEIINSEVNQKPKRDYAPLTDEQRESLSEDEIKRWETEAKKGLFFNDTDLRSMSDSMRFILPNQDRAALYKMGISVSDDYADRGKLVFDEAKFKAALEENPDAVKDIFTREASKDADGNKIDGGVMTKMKSTMDLFAGTTGATKGILIERAGSIYAPTSLLKNSMQRQMDSIDDIVDRLKDKLKTEQDRYIRQFTSLETAISQMNSQSGWLSQFGGTQ